jgi:hypothetical protein
MSKLALQEITRQPENPQVHHFIHFVPDTQKRKTWLIRWFCPENHTEAGKSFTPFCPSGHQK